MMNSAVWFAIAWKSVAVLALAWLAARCLLRRSAAARHLVWVASSAVLVALPLLSLSLPTLRVPTPEAASTVFRATAIAAETSATPPAATPPLTRRAKQAPALRGLALPLLLVWMLGSLTSLLRMLASYASVTRIRRAAHALDAQGLGVPLLEARSDLMPMTIGILRPAILLPSGASQWNESLRQAVLLHELAHIRRGDTSTQLLARIALALYWWNPLAWAAWRQTLKEAERAADDAVLCSGAHASDYAGHLLDIARSMRPLDAAAWPAVAMVRPSNLETRLRAILNPGLRRAAPSRTAAFLSLALALLAAAPLAAIHAQGPQVPVPASGADGMDLTRRGDLAWKQGHRKAAVTYYQNALHLLAGRPQSAHLLERLGEASILDKNYSQAAAYFEQMAQTEPGRAAMWQAVVAGRETNPSLSAQLFGQALSLEDPKSLDAAITLDIYAGLLRETGQGAKADELTSRAAAIRKAMSVRADLPPGAYRIGTDVLSPRLSKKREPRYSDEARAARLTGAVVLRIVVGVDGIPHDVKVVRPLGLGLDQQAIDSVNQWRFKPGTKDGQPVPVLATVEVNFRLI